MKKRQWVVLGITLGILTFAIGAHLILAMLKEEPETKKPVAAKKYVSTVPVTYEDIKTHVIAYGRVETAHSLDLLSEVSGRMYAGQVPLKEGQRFGKGTLLFYIDDTEAKLNVKSQKSNFLKELAGILPDLKIDYSENYSAWKDFFASISVDKNLPQLPEVKSEKEKTFIATKGIYSTYYTIKSAEERLRKHRYYAPFKGSISDIAMESGAFVNPGTRIGTILKSNLHELRISVSTKDIPWIQMESEVEVFSEETQQSWKGAVTRISDYVNPNTQSVDVFVLIEPGKQKIYDGQFIQAAIPARTIHNGMIIPRNILYEENEVFVVEDTLLKVKSVNVHRLMEEEAIISGLDPGENLVIEPLVGAHNNMVVYQQEKKDIDLETGVADVRPDGGKGTSGNSSTN